MRFLINWTINLVPGNMIVHHQIWSPLHLQSWNSWRNDDLLHPKQYLENQWNHNCKRHICLQIFLQPMMEPLSRNSYSFGNLLILPNHTSSEPKIINFMENSTMICFQQKLKLDEDVQTHELKWKENMSEVC